MSNSFKDIKLSRRDLDVETSDREFVDLKPSGYGDLAVVADRENLAQALTNRLLTRQGELTQLGHPDYGSKLYLLVGELNNLRTRARAELYLRECLKQERRIEEKIDIRFNAPTRDYNRSTLTAYIKVRPIAAVGDILLTIPINL